MVVARFGIFFSSFFKNRKVVADVVLRVSYSVRHALTWRRPQHSWRPSDNYFLLVRPYRYKKWKKKKKMFLLLLRFLLTNGQCWNLDNKPILCVCVRIPGTFDPLFRVFIFPSLTRRKKNPQSEREAWEVYTHTQFGHWPYSLCRLRRKGEISIFSCRIRKLFSSSWKKSTSLGRGLSTLVMQLASLPVEWIF